MNTQTEPALTIGGLTLGSITAATGAVLVILRVFDIYTVSDDQYAAIVAAIAALWFVVIPMIYSIRGIVFAPATVQEIKEDLATAPAVPAETAKTLAS